MVLLFTYALYTNDDEERSEPHMSKKLLSLLFTLVLAFSVVSAFAESETSILTELPIYYYDSVNVNTLDVAFFNGCMDIPYCSAETVVQLMSSMTDSDMESGYTTYGSLAEANLLSIGEETDSDCEVFYFLRENGALVFFDFEENVIWINDRDLLVAKPYAVSGGDLLYSDGYFYDEDHSILMDSDNDRPLVNLYRRVAKNSYKREGEVTVIYLNDYSISMELYEGHCYVPLATVSDILTPDPITFNGEALFVTGGGLEKNLPNDDDLTQYELYYQTAEKERSAELADFTYNELCLMLDNCYGLRNEHGAANGFDNFFIAGGLYTDLHSTDPHVFSDALAQVLYGYFGDQHSSLTSMSPYAGSEYKATNKNDSITWVDSNRLRERFQKAREASGITVGNEIQDGYCEIGDTAFVTFDSFVSASCNYYDSDLWGNFADIYMSDTISLVIWAHDRIHRENSPIRKVVIDLSCNGGGSLNACIYIASWVLGAANLSIENVTTGAQYTTVYWVDVDRDGACTFDDELGVDDLDVYCLVNGNSFSCGNLLPTLFKQDGRVTLVGQTTGGGACLVRHTSAADGTLFTISDYYRLSIVKNGSFYNIDRGVEADIPLRKPASFYDRPALVEYLDTIR